MATPRLVVGIDDTDSKKGMCTTYVAAVALRRLDSLGARRVDYPRLVRLNPNCPFKTRGNAALSFIVEAGSGELEDAKETVIKTVSELAEAGEPGTEPGIVFMKEEARGRMTSFYWRAVRELVDPREAITLCERYGVEAYSLSGERGLVGALAAAVADESSLSTYELIAYRTRGFWGRPRLIDPESVKEMDRLTRPLTFDNYDYEERSVRITPHTPCPVLLGIRAIDPGAAERGFRALRIGEPVEFYEVFRTNQATDIHYVPATLHGAIPGASVALRGVIMGKPRITPGGHVFAELSDGHGRVTLAAYEPTGRFRGIVARLVGGDEVEAYGALKMKEEGLTLNLEKLRVLRLADLYVYRPPRCPRCGRRTESNGRGKGYKCRRCGLRDRNLLPEREKILREIRPGAYEVAASARRHLARPLSLSEGLWPHDEHREG